jgi:hypothetical protein
MKLFILIIIIFCCIGCTKDGEPIRLDSKPGIDYQLRDGTTDSDVGPVDAGVDIDGTVAGDGEVLDDSRQDIEIEASTN